MIYKDPNSKFFFSILTKVTQLCEGLLRTKGWELHNVRVLHIYM